MNDAIQRAIDEQRAKSNQPKNWLCVTDAELYALLAGDVPESVKLQCYEVSDAGCEARLIQNSERLERPKPKRKTA